MVVCLIAMFVVVLDKRRMNVNEMLVKWMSGVVLSLLAGTCSGCTMTLADKGEFGFKQSTSWGFYHEATATEAKATSKLEAPTIIDWLTGGIDEAVGSVVVPVTGTED